MLDFPRWKVVSIWLTIAVLCALAIPSLIPQRITDSWGVNLPRIKGSHNAMKTGMLAAEAAFAALRAGASGFLLKDARPAELAEAIRTVAAGDAVVAPRVTRRMLELFADRLPDGQADTPEDPRLAALTAREREVLVAIAEGLSNAEIASRLYLSEATVKTHVAHVLDKLGVRDRVQAVVVALQTGLVAP